MSLGTTRDENAPNKLGGPESQTCLGIFGVVPARTRVSRDPISVATWAFLVALNAHL
jgi:hypothetical protein